MNQANRNIVVLFAVVFFVALWGIAPTLAGDGGYCTGLGQVATLNQGETREVPYNHLCGCTLKYVLHRPAIAADCSTIRVVYKSSLGQGGDRTQDLTTTVCGSDSADAEHKYVQTRKDYFPQHATFTCKTGVCRVSFGLVWYE